MGGGGGVLKYECSEENRGSLRTREAREDHVQSLRVEVAKEVVVIVFSKGSNKYGIIVGDRRWGSDGGGGENAQR